MARIELEITGNIKGLQGALGGAVAALNAFEKASNSSTSEVSEGLEKANTTAKKVERTFTLLSKAPFSFGVNGAKAAGQVTTALEQTEKQAQGLNRTFSLIKNPSFSFGVGALGGIKQSANEAAPAVRNLTRSISGVNTVGIEFSRIIQDAPYGIIGVGNNITQLTQSFANLRAQTNSTGQALGIAFKSMFSGANLLVLGVSLVTTAFTVYNMWARKNKKATDDLADGTKTYVETLEGVARAQADGLINSQKEVTSLRVLYDATQNLTLPMESRRKAADEIIKQYPKQFEGLTTEAILVGDASTAYKELNATLVATATAMANLDRIRENANAVLDKRLIIQDKENQAAEKAREIAKQRAILDAERTAGSSGQFSEQRIIKLQQEHNSILEEARELGGEIASLTRQSNQLQNDYNNQIGLGADLSGKVTSNLKGGKKEIEQTVKLSESLEKLRQESIQASLEGYTKELQASQNKYNELSRQAKDYYREGKVSAREYADYIARLQGFRVGEAGRITGGAQRVPLAGPSRGAGQVVPAQLPNQVAKVVATDPVWDEFVKDFDKQLSRSVQSFGRDFFRSIRSLSEQFKGDVGGAFGSIVNNLTSGIADVTTSIFSKMLSDKMSSAFSGPQGKQIANWSAGLGFAGGAIGGLTKRTSVAGQGLSGALSGAGAGLATGAAFGSAGGPIGAAIGAVVGAVAGILSASSAKKAQEAQLAESRKQTALLERANALAYASSIIGQMTAGGFVSGIVRDAFGQLVATVKGSDLQFVLQRAGGSR